MTSQTASVTVSTDGSCLRNPGGPSGWAWYVDEDCHSSGGFASGTNQQAELMAVLAALRQIPVDVPLLVRVDSQYTLNSVTTWIKGWKARGWRKADGGEVANLDLMKALDDALAARAAPTRFEWVRGHNGDHGNSWADHHATAASRAAAAGRSAPATPGWGDGPTGRTAQPPASDARPRRRSRR
jgi:ribonuclease HI